VCGALETSSDLRNDMPVIRVSGKPHNVNMTEITLPKEDD